MSSKRRKKMPNYDKPAKWFRRKCEIDHCFNQALKKKKVCQQHLRAG